MARNVANEVNALKQMTVSELRARHAELFGEETRCRHKDHLWKRIAWRLQAVAEGDLSDRARQRAVELASDADLRLRAPSRVILEAAPDYTVIGPPSGRPSVPRNTDKACWASERLVRERRRRSVKC